MTEKFDSGTIKSPKEMMASTPIMALTPDLTTPCQEVTVGTSTTTSDKVIVEDKVKHAKGDDLGKEHYAGDVNPILKSKQHGVSEGILATNRLSVKTSYKGKEKLSVIGDRAWGKKAECGRGHRKPKPTKSFDPILASLKMKREGAHAYHLGKMEKTRAYATQIQDPYTMG